MPGAVHTSHMYADTVYVHRSSVSLLHTALFSREHTKPLQKYRVLLGGGKCTQASDARELLSSNYITCT